MAKKVEPPKKVSKVKQTILAIAIAIVLALFVGWGIYTIHPGPKYEQICSYATKPVPPTITEANCAQYGGTWNSYPEVQKCTPGVECPQGFCDMYSKCQKEFQDADNAYSRLVFIIATIIGLIAVVVGGVVLRLESVSTGIMGGGVLCIIYGVIRYWGAASNWLRLIILGVILAILIWMGYKKLNPKD